MFTPDFIFISITLFILSALAFKMNAPKVTIPLLLIYTVFIIDKLPYFETHHTSSNETLQSRNEKDGSLEKAKLEPNESNKTVDDLNIKLDSEKDIEVDEPPVPEVKINSKMKVEPKIEKIQKPKATVEKDAKESIKSLVTLKDIKICKNIKNRNPVGIGEIFSNSVDSLYCFTKIENLGKKIEVRHVWYYENQIMTQVRYNVKKSNIYRSWTKKTISSYQIGNWRVEVQDRNGTIIGSKRFTIKKSS